MFRLGFHDELCDELSGGYPLNWAAAAHLSGLSRRVAILQSRIDTPLASVLMPGRASSPRLRRSAGTI